MGADIGRSGALIILHCPGRDQGGEREASVIEGSIGEREPKGGRQIHTDTLTRFPTLTPAFEEGPAVRSAAAAAHTAHTAEGSPRTEEAGQEAGLVAGEAGIGLGSQPFPSGT